MDQIFHYHLQEITCNYTVFSRFVQRPQCQSIIQNLKHKHGRVKTTFFSLFMVFHLLAKNPLLFPRSFSVKANSSITSGFKQHDWILQESFAEIQKRWGRFYPPTVYTPESDAICSKTLILPTVFFLPTVKIKKIHFGFGKFSK